MNCDQCQMLSINGVACHETGCPNMGARWDGEGWVKQCECRECGCMADVGSECCNGPTEVECADGSTEWVDDEELEAAAAIEAAWRKAPGGAEWQPL